MGDSLSLRLQCFVLLKYECLDLANRNFVTAASGFQIQEAAQRDHQNKVLGYMCNSSLSAYV